MSNQQSAEQMWTKAGAALAAVRKAAKVTRYDLVTEMGVPYARVQRAEEGRIEIDPDFDRHFREAVARIATRRAERASAALITA